MRKVIVFCLLDILTFCRYVQVAQPSAHRHAALCSQGGGVFCSPRSPSAKPKQRLLYECVPLAASVEAAGSASHHGTASILDRRTETSAERSMILSGHRRLSCEVGGGTGCRRHLSISRGWDTGSCLLVPLLHTRVYVSDSPCASQHIRGSLRNFEGCVREAHRFSRKAASEINAAKNG
jgi:hypothetical protein